MPERQYNFIFSKLVEKDDDMLGLLAYGLYKQQKIEYIAQFKKEHGRGPTHEELATFHDLTSSQTQIENYKQLAEIRFNSILNKVMEDNLEAFRKAAHQGQSDAIAELKPSNRERILSGIVGNFSFIIFCALLFGAAAFINADYPGQIMTGIKILFGFQP